MNRTILKFLFPTGSNRTDLIQFFEFVESDFITDPRRLYCSSRARAKSDYCSVQTGPGTDMNRTARSTFKSVVIRGVNQTRRSNRYPVRVAVTTTDQQVVLKRTFFYRQFIFFIAPLFRFVSFFIFQIMHTYAFYSVKSEVGDQRKLRTPP